MTKMDHEKRNREKRVRTNGWETPDGPGLPPNETHGVSPPRTARPHRQAPGKRHSKQMTSSPQSTSGRRETPFETAYRCYLLDHARAVVNGWAQPYVPDIIKRRYQGDRLSPWKKGALTTERYKMALKQARIERARHRATS